MKTIPVGQGKETIVDDDMYDELSKYRWYVRRSKKRFAVASDNGPGGGRARIARVVINAPNGYYVHHRNGDILDNRRENLFLVHHGEWQVGDSSRSHIAKNNRSRSRNDSRERKSEHERFWMYVGKNSNTDCWEWTGSKTLTGYGHLNINAKSIYAHRISYELFNGPIPDGLCVCHSCDNPGCVNPSHLWVGTMADNMHDRDAKGRGRNRIKKNTCSAG